MINYYIQKRYGYTIEKYIYRFECQDSLDCLYFGIWYWSVYISGLAICP